MFPNICFLDGWRNFGLLWVYVAVNIAGAFGLYYLARVPRGAKAQEIQSDSTEAIDKLSNTRENSQ